MKHNYLLYIVLFLVIVMRGTLINMINNIGSILFSYNTNLEVTLLKARVKNLESEYNELLNFKNNINIKEEYIITNVYKNNYSFDKLLINGNNYNINDEVISNNRLVGLVSKKYSNYSEISYIFDTHIAVKVNDYEGKIVGKDKDNNLIIREITNKNNININDKVYSINNIYIGKVIKINKEIIDTNILVDTIDIKGINYVAVISR